jgi:2-polyprenyl-3-methyl-5-hydroxy-6-metoxy-1,4-benzoquinol methylase
MMGVDALHGAAMMPDTSRQDHWNGVYTAKAENEVSWFQSSPEASLDLIGRFGGLARASVIDIGGGASRLVDALVAAGWRDLTVLDLSSVALGAARKRLGEAASHVEWIVTDVTQWRPHRTYDVWHDRAAFHFLTQAADRAAYVAALDAAVPSGGHAIIATFAPDGPERCSGLPVVRYDPQELAKVIGPSFELVGERRQLHATPSGGSQSFQFSVLRRVV